MPERNVGKDKPAAAVNVCSVAAFEHTVSLAGDCHTFLRFHRPIHKFMNLDALHRCCRRRLTTSQREKPKKKIKTNAAHTLTQTHTQATLDMITSSAEYFL